MVKIRGEGGRAVHRQTVHRNAMDRPCGWRRRLLVGRSGLGNGAESQRSDRKDPVSPNSTSAAVAQAP
jgi:hypothetical protein